MRAPRDPVTRPAAASGLDDGAGAAGGLDALARTGAEGVGVNGQRLRDLALGQHLDRDLLARRQAVGLHQLQGHLGAGCEALLQGGDVDRLGVRAEHLDGHRLLHVGAAELSHAHVDRHLAALEVGPALGARARARALLAAAGGLAGARSFAASDPLARPAADGRGREAVEPDPLLAVLGGAYFFSSTFTRWRTACTMPRA